MDHFTDYYRYTWQVVEPPQPPLVIFLHRLPGYLAIIAIIHFAYTTQFFKELDDSARIFVSAIVFILTLGLLVIIHLILNQIAHSRGPRLCHSSVNREGITIRRRHYPYTLLSRPKTLHLINALILPQNQWSDMPQPLSLTLPATKTLTLNFPNETVRQKTLASLHHYLS
jgi:hypothetical protein